MGAYAEHKQPSSLPRRGGGGCSRHEDSCHDCAHCLRAFCIASVVAALFLLLGWFIYQSTISPEYTIAITGVSGLDPETDLVPGRGVLSPAFNLTVGMASYSALYGECIGPGTSIRVSYSHLHLPMASGRAPEMCVGPREAAAPRAAVAHGHDVVVPGYLVDSLAEDMRRGEAMFQVQLTGMAPPEDGYGLAWRSVNCWVRVGEAAGAVVDRPCYKTWRNIDRVPDEDSGRVPYPVPTAGPHPSY